MTTSIEWTDQTWNPIVGCSRVSKGCEHCYAERVAHRGMTESHKGLTVMGKHGPRWTGEVRFLPDRLDEPLSWRKARRVFVNSMSDLFHEGVSNEQIAAVFGVMAACPQHTFQVLTKRPERALEWFRWIGRDAPGRVRDFEVRGCALATAQILREATPAAVHAVLAHGAPWPLRNVDLGVSVEDQATADERIPHLIAMRPYVGGALWVSYEPAIGPVIFRPWLPSAKSRHVPAGPHGRIDSRDPHSCPTAHRAEFGEWCACGIDWIVIGGESGPGARPFDVAWARSTIAQCREAGVPCFVKQLGANVRTRNDDNFTIDEDPPDPDFPGWPLHLEAEGRIEWNPDGPEHYQGAPVRVHLRDRKGGDMSEWRSDLRVRQWPGVQR